MKSFVIFCLCLASAFSAEEINNRNVTQKIRLDDGLPRGDWGIMDTCPPGSFVRGIRTRYKPDSGGLSDETALESIFFLCGNHEYPDMGVVSSSIGKDGDFSPANEGSYFTCNTGLYVTGYRARTLQDQGLVNPDIGVYDLEISCGTAGEQIIDAIDDSLSSQFTQNPNYGNWLNCVSGTSVCGFMTRWDGGLFDDKTAICDIELFCCRNDE